MFIFFPNFPTFSFLCLTLNIFLLHYSNSSWNIIHLYFSTCLHIHASSVVIHAFSTWCCTVNYTLLLFYATPSLRIHTSTPVWFWYCTVNYMLVLFYATPLRLYTSTVLRLYTSKPLRLYASTPLRLYASMPLRLYASTPLGLYTSRPLHFYT